MTLSRRELILIQLVLLGTKPQKVSTEQQIQQILRNHNFPTLEEGEIENFQLELSSCFLEITLASYLEYLSPTPSKIEYIPDSKVLYIHIEGNLSEDQQSELFSKLLAFFFPVKILIIYTDSKDQLEYRFMDKTSLLDWLMPILSPEDLNFLFQRKNLSSGVQDV